jgi:hypothetical protein
MALRPTLTDGLPLSWYTARVGRGTGLGCLALEEMGKPRRLRPGQQYRRLRNWGSQMTKSFFSEMTAR